VPLEPTVARKGLAL